MASPSLSLLSDPGSLAKLQILLVPVHTATPLQDHTFTYWSNLIKRHSVLRGDELARPVSTSSHTRGSSTNPRARFLPPSSSSSISRGGAPNHVHIAYPAQPPARHLASLSLLRIAAFPLVVIGITAEAYEGYSIEEEDDGDIGQSSKTPTVSTFRQREKGPSESFDDAIRELFPTTSPFPLVKRLIVVPPDAPTSPSPRSSPRKNGKSTPRGVGKDRGDISYAPEEGREGWISRLLGEVVGDALGELGELATALETPSGLKTLSATLLPSLTSTLPTDHLFPGQYNTSTPTLDAPPRSRSTTPVLPHSQSVSDLSTRNGVGISLTRALTPGGRPTSVGPPSQPPITSQSISPSPVPTPPTASSNPFRRSTAISSPFTRSSSTVSLASQASSHSPSTTMTGTKYTTANLHGLAGGRLLKLLGDMYLLAGMYTDAIKCYDDGAERCRAVGDILWEGLAREGRAVAGIGEAWEGRDGSNMTQAFPNHPIPVEILSHFLSALACISRAPLPYPPTILSPSPQAVSGTLSFSAPSASNPSSIGTGEGLLAFLHTGLALRISHFLLIIWASGGWGSIALSALLSHSLPRSFPPPLSTEEQRLPDTRRKRKRALDKLGFSSLMSRHSILEYAEAALGPHHRAMTKSEQLALHVEVVWLARWLDFPRKEACITREVVKRIAVMVVEARDEARRMANAGFRKKSPTHDASVGLGLGMAVPTQAVAVRRKESSDGNAGVIALFERALSLMGVDLLDPEQPRVEAPSTFGWPELQVEMMKEGIAVAEALPDHLAVVRLCTSALHSLHSHLNGPSQTHVAKMYPGALATIKRRGMDMGTIPWWIPGKMVLSVELTSLPPNRIPIEHSSAEIVATEGKDPFLYNPRLRAAEGKTVLVANEQTDVYVTLRNPFAFDVELQDVSLITFGVGFTTNPLSINLPANSIQAIRITGVATSAGSLQIRGVSLRLADGSSAEFLLPLLNDTDRQKRDKRKSRLTADLSKAKKQGMEARWSMQSIPSDESVEKWMECKVVEEQPLVWIKKTSLTHGTVMLYNGESSTIRITLENSSSIPVDFVKLSFEDSASRIAQSVLNEGEVTRQQAYELQYDTIKRPVFVWDADAEVTIPPGGRTTIAVACLGKVGCADGSIRIDYGHVRRGASEVPTTFQTRQITFPVLFTVYHTLEPHSLDVVRLVPGKSDDSTEANGFLAAPVPSRKASGSVTPRTPSLQTMGESMLTETLSAEMDDGHCLLGLSVRNVYGQPFEVSLRRIGEEEVVANRLVPPGATERLILPVPRLSLDHETSSKPIPTLSERQYVVDKEKKTPEQVARERQLFWYCEELLNSLEATWVEPGSKRSGVLSLRGQSLTHSHLDVLRLDDLEINLEVEPREGDVIRATDFSDITLTLVNRLDRPFTPYVRIEPLPSTSTDTSWTTSSSPHRRQSTIPMSMRNVVFDGSLCTILDPVPPGKSVSHIVGAVFLARGEFGFRAAVEEAVEGEPKIRFSPLLRVNVE